MNLAILIFIFFIVLIRVLYVIFQCGIRTARSRKMPAKTVIILGSGGHTTEMLRLVKHLNFDFYTPRIYIHSQTDSLSLKRVKELEANNKDFELISIFRCREVGQSYLSLIWSIAYASLNCFPIAWTKNPDLILCNGPGTCVPICSIIFLLRICFISNVKMVFIESFCRVRSLSLSGKLLYLMADQFIVQWPNLCKPFVPSVLYKKTVYI